MGVLLSFSSNSLYERKWEKMKCNTFRQRNGDDDTVSCPHPQSAAGHHQSCDSHKREAQFTRTCNTHTEHTLVSVRVQKIWSKEFSIDLKYRDAVAHVLYFRTEAIHYKYCMYVTIDSFYTAFIHKLQTESQRRDMDLRNVCIPNILLT